MTILLNAFKWPSLLVLAMSAAAISTQGRSGSTATMEAGGGPARGNVVVYKEGEAVRTFGSPEAEPDPITLSDPELEARIRAVGSEAFAERRSPGSRVTPMWSADSPEYRLAKQVDARLHKERLAEMEARREGLPPLERMAVFDISGVVDDEDLAPHRFSDTSRLFSMLRDPFWSRYWGSIAVTIARVADEESALKLIEFIKDSELPKGHEREANEARLRAIRALPEPLKGQEVSGVREFLEQLTDRDFVGSLDFKRPDVQNAMARYNSYYALGAIGDDKSVSVLERLYQEAQAQKRTLELQPLSNDRKSDKAADQNLTVLEMHLNRAKSKQLGVPDTLDGTRDSGLRPRR